MIALSSIIFYCLWGLFLNQIACFLINGYTTLYTCWSGKRNLLYSSLVVVLTIVSLTNLFHNCVPSFQVSYFVFISALIITFRTDIEWMLISRIVTLYLIPIGLLFAWLNMLPLSLPHALIASISAYCLFFLIGYIFHKITHQTGLGQGDVELMAFIGAFTGIQGWWITLLIGSLIGSLIGIIYMISIRQYKSVKIPFGPFLALGALTYLILICNNTVLPFLF